MSVPSVKRITLGVVSTLLITLQLSSPVLAASDETARAAAQTGMNYLAANQQTNGSITGFGGETEWAVIADVAAGHDPAAFSQPSGTSAIHFLESDAEAAATPATTIERKALAIAAAHQDLTTFGGIDYIASLQAQHQSNQIGDPTLLNDDIFGIIAIDAAQTDSLRATAQDGLDYLLAHQQADGGFSYTTTTCAFCSTDSNDTAAALIAFNAAEHMGLTNSSLATAKDKATAYLLSTQMSDGGFGYDIFSPSDGSSSAWGLMALNMIGDSVQVQAQTARDWLLAHQNADGGFSYAAFGLTDSSTAITAHAVVALLGSSWLLRPTPMQPPATTSSAPITPVTSSSAAPSTTAPALQTAAAGVALAASSTPTDIQVESSPAPQQPAQTKGAHTTKTYPTKAPAKSSTSSKTNYAPYAALPALFFVAGGWFVLQSRNKPESETTNV